MPQNLTPKQRATIAALLSQPTLSAAAKQVGVSRDAVYRWLKEPDFAAALVAAESEHLQSVQRGMLAASERALVVLGNLLVSESESIRLRAALGILEQVIRLRQLIDFDARLTALEQAANG